MREAFVAVLALGVLGSAVFSSVGVGRGGPSASATDEAANIAPENIPS